MWSPALLMVRDETSRVLTMNGIGHSAFISIVFRFIRRTGLPGWPARTHMQPVDRISIWTHISHRPDDDCEQ